MADDNRHENDSLVHHANKRWCHYCNKKKHHPTHFGITRLASVTAQTVCGTHTYTQHTQRMHVCLTQTYAVPNVSDCAKTAAASYRPVPPYDPTPQLRD